MLKPDTCNGCPLQNLSTSFSKPYGKGANGVLILGESLSHDDAIEGRPFTPKSQAGSKLKECILSNGYKPDDFLLWNVIACQPPGNRIQGQWFTDRATAACKQYLKAILHSWVPQAGKRKVILAVGNTPFQVATGRSDSVQDTGGYVFESILFSEVYLVIGSYHPGWIKRGNAPMTPILTAHIRKAVEIAGQDQYGMRTVDDLQKELADKRARYGYTPPPTPGVRTVDMSSVDDDDVPF